MKPSLGRIVLVPFGGAGEFLAPAIVTAVHADGVVDCVAFMASPKPGALPVIELPPGVGQVAGVPGNDAGWIWPPMQPRTEA